MSSVVPLLVVPDSVRLGRGTGDQWPLQTSPFSSTSLIEPELKVSVSVPTKTGAGACWVSGPRTGYKPRRGRSVAPRNKESDRYDGHCELLHGSPRCRR